MTKAIYKYAAIVTIAIVGVAGYELIGWRDLKAADWAAWVQAVGSVAAIWAAYKISEREAATQRQSAKEQAAVELAQRRETVVELMEYAASLCHQLAADVTSDALGYLHASGYRSSDFEYAIKSLEAIDLVSLQSIHLVRGIIGMISETRAAQQTMDAVISKHDPVRLGQVAEHCERAETSFARAMLAIGIEPKYCPFDPEEDAYEASRAEETE